MGKNDAAGLEGESARVAEAAGHSEEGYNATRLKKGRLQAQRRDSGRGVVPGDKYKQGGTHEEKHAAGWRGGLG